MDQRSTFEQVTAPVTDRRKFVRGLLAAGTVAEMVGFASGARAQSASGPTDLDILNFALNLEYLEAEFYTVATTGQTISQMGIGVSGSGNTGPTTGGQKVSLTDSLSLTSTAALQIAQDERAHVTLIRTAISSLGGMPIAKPAINLNALGVGFNNQDGFLTLARAFEDVGVTAYAGAAPLIQSSSVLGTAARIAETESEHSANIRQQVAEMGIPTTALDGADIIPPPSGIRIFPVDEFGLTQVRTPGQVLFIVYGLQANAKSGGFFPNGVNGTINASTSAAPVPPPLTILGK